MMKLFVYTIVICFLFSCDTENGSDCLKTSGETITKSYDLDDFDRVIFREGIELELLQGERNHIEISFGKNLIDNVSTFIDNKRLYIENSTSCNHIRNVQAAKVILTVNNIIEIRNASQFKLFSKDTLRLPSLLVISENFNENEVNVGDVELIVNNQNLGFISNGASNYTITGKTNNLNINFAAGQGKFNGEKLIAQHITFFHRGANEVLIYPIQELRGEIRSSGNIISLNRPPIIDVKEFYTGKLMFSN